ncbi:GFA family protein [Alkalimarinus coralli]|uniref:GFA family protein n=1 Tax=Alkalimarinus coralli TaxID=2935863 RepID=UPI00202B4B5C|nr:GFA family protein [Alkalimarinus coralli]
MEIKPIMEGRCHCGGVEFEVKLPNGFEELSRCDCSMCSRRGAVVTSVPIELFRITNGSELLTLYEFNTKTAKHYFCSRCGIYTHHKRRSNPNHYALNVACLDGINPFELGDIPTTDGINHSADRDK